MSTSEPDQIDPNELKSGPIATHMARETAAGIIVSSQTLLE